MAFADRAAPLLDGMPARRRVGAEIAWILALLYAPGAVPVSARMDTLLNGAFWLVLLGAGVTIAAPWRAWDEGRRPEAVAWVLILAVAVAAVVWSSHAPSLPRPRLGVVLVIGERTAGDPPGCGIAEVRSVVAGSASDGVLHPGDRICMVNGRALDPTAPVSDLVARLRGPGLSSGPLALLVVRAGERMEARVHLPDRPASPVSVGARLLARALAVIGAVFVLVRAAGQSPAQLGLPRQGLLREAAVGAPLLVATWMVHLAVSVPIVLLYAAVSGWRSIEAQAGDRVSVLTDLTGQVGSLPIMVVVGLTAAAFEEIAFRGFLLPRLGFVTGRWWIAIALSSALFGLGHFYEGPLAVIQTAALGVWFCVVVLHRGRLVATIVAHAAFNAMAVAALVLLGSSGVLDALKGTPLPGP